MQKFGRLIFSRRQVEQDGFGQSLLDDVRFMIRFRSCRNRITCWRRPSDAECAEFDVHPIIGRFGDQTQFVATVGVEQWIVRDRDWWGWPDPSRYVFFAMQAGRIRVAADFNTWPPLWSPDPDGDSEDGQCVEQSGIGRQ